MKILLLSAYDAMSHRYWRKGLVAAFPEHQWTVLSLPPRYFSWRMRGNSLSWAFGERELLEQYYDLLVCTSMTDLSALKGMVPQLAGVPTLCYFHENQFAYPQSAEQKQSVEPLILNIYTALAADQVLFNTAYNRNTFLEGAEKLLKKLPDHVPANVVQQLRDSSSVLPVPLPDDVFMASENDRSGSLQIVFNHRWEYDKAPERFFRALEILKDRKVSFRAHVVGQSFRNVPSVFKHARSHLGENIGTWGYIESVGEYRSLLGESDVVVSTAVHDFQGIAVLEAVAAGCRPVVPDRLAYTELFAHRYRYSSFLDDPEAEAQELAGRLQALAEHKEAGQWEDVPDMRGLSWQSLRPCYQQWLEARSL
ncbi:MAG: tRNA-queuosine alpha-mannosyltransferase domain-containing protein [Endozoicomonas sp.]